MLYTPFGAAFQQIIRIYFSSINNLLRSHWIQDYIDDTEQMLTEVQLMDTGYTNIGYAMTKGALFKDD